MGLLQQLPDEFLQETNHRMGSAHGRLGVSGSSTYTAEYTIESIQQLIEKRVEAKKAKNFAEADRIRKELADAGIILEDTPQGTTWRRA
jgi:cysteinyl-tRNA synthetase